jgi:hypothetical protein
MVIVLGIDETPSPDAFERPLITIGPLATESSTVTPENTIEVAVAVVVVRPDTVGVPVNRPVGKVNVTVPLLGNAVDGVIVTVNVPAEVTCEVGAQTAVPVTRDVDGTHLFKLLSQIVPTSQHPGP